MSPRGPIIEAIHYRVTRLRRIRRRGVMVQAGIEIAAIVYTTAALFAVLLLVGG